MKRFLSIILALAMVLSATAIVFADEAITCDVAAVLNGDAPTGVGDVFKVDFVIKNISNKNFITTKLKYNLSDTIVPSTEDGTVLSADIYNGDDDDYLMEDFYVIPRRWSPIFDDMLNAAGEFEYNGVMGISIYSTTYTEGIEASEFTVSAYFKVVKDGNIAINFISEAEDRYGVVVQTHAGKATINSFTNLAIGEQPKPEVVTKTIESVDVSSITTNLQAPVEYTIPTALKGKIAGSDETVDVTVAWTPAVVTESVKATGVVTAPADTETVKYVLADAAKTLTVDFTVEPEKPEVVTKTIESVDVSPITTNLQAPVEYTIPTALKGKIAGSDETVDVTVAWTPAVVTESVKATGVVTVPADTETVKYVLADAAKTLTVDFTVEPEKPEVVIKTIESVDVSAIELNHKAPVEYTIPTALKGKIADSDETVDVTVAWTPAVVTESVKATGVVTAPADTETVKYVLADEAKTLTLEFVVEPEDEPKDEPVEIVSVVAPEITVYVGTASDDVKAQLGETVVGLTADGEEVAVAVEWSGTVDTKKAGNKSVRGTLTAPEGYVLAKKLTTVTATVHVVKVPADTTIDSVEELAPITVFAGEKVALPATVVGYVTETATVDVTVEWPEVDTSVAGVQEITGKLVAPNGYDLAEGLTEVKVIVTVIALADLPVELGEVVVNEADGQVVIPFRVKPEYASYVVGGKSLDDYSELVISITYMNGITPVAVTGTTQPRTGSNWSDVEGEFKFFQTIPAGADTIQYCVVVGYDPAQPISITNLGIPVGAARPYVIGE